METEIKLDLITIADPSVLRAIKHTRTQNYSKEAIDKDKARDTPKGLENSKVCIFSIGGKVFHADIKDEISKIIMEGRQSELYSISFTAGDTYKDAKDVERQGINYSSHLTKTQRQEDIDFEQSLLISQSKATLHIEREKAKIAMMVASIDLSKINLKDLESTPLID